MPQPAQRSLVQVLLLLWITVLSIIQIVFFTYFFTFGHHDKPQNCSAVDTRIPMPHMGNEPLNQVKLGKGKMLTFKAEKENRTLKWVPLNPVTGLFSEKGDALTIDNDGYFFINLQLKLETCNDTSPQDIKVSLKWTNDSQESREIMQGWINRNTCSTSFAKVVELTSGTLEVTFNSSAHNVDTTESSTHLDVIFMTSY
ncbi:uncharacterized protein LOC122868655 isoform X2 [Xyrichtys novacula]|uniref:Uncharacterized protein LOC122868655 isoform X2 n=1 Tax=Xyrichtys novacula TaxID=13765 RepID=A0AAV1GQ40_XYRNO|nr:uncharacterized protein LOC122868655 isoform X2 [Xyrichtys novacula]